MRDEFSDPGIASDVEESIEAGLRPRALDEFVGQRELKEHLSIVLEAARRRGQSVDHLLFAGPPGLGKTTLAGIVATEMQSHLHITSGPALERAGDLAAILTKLEEGDVLFVDEIHRLSRAVEEILYPAMEDFQLDIVVGKGPAASSIRLTMPPFTLVGATTRTGMITGPLRDRFGLVARLDYYEDDELQQIVVRAAGIFDVAIDTDGAWEIARRSRGTPRIANRLLRRVRDFAEVRHDGAVTADIAREGLALFGVDDLGLDKVDRAILRAMCVQFNGGPVGLSTVAISVGEQPDTVEDVYEPFLIQQGMIARTPPRSSCHAGRLSPPGVGRAGAAPRPTRPVRRLTPFGHRSGPSLPTSVRRNRRGAHMGIRRVVTGHDDDGKAIFASDEVVEPVTSDLVPGMEFFRLWGSDAPNRFPDDGSAPVAVQYFPPLDGYRFGLFTVPPDSTVMLDDVDFDAAFGDIEAKLPGLMGHMEPDAPGMHTTATVDYEYVASGRVVLELDDGVHP